jgi:ribose/xylose/arabinose/galactoside ABC-type transport system permease subunit
LVSGLGYEPAETYFWLGHKALIDIPGVVKIPVAVAATAAVFIVGHIILNHRRFGRQLYAIGGNRQAAVASGIDAVVAGASRGIGAAIARALGREAARVAVHYGTHRQEAEAVCVEIVALFR